MRINHLVLPDIICNYPDDQIDDVLIKFEDTNKLIV